MSSVGGKGPRGPSSAPLPEAPSAGAGCLGLSPRMEPGAGTALGHPADVRCHGEGYFLYLVSDIPVFQLRPLPFAFLLCFGACLSGRAWVSVFVWSRAAPLPQ